MAKIGFLVQYSTVLGLTSFFCENYMEYTLEGTVQYTYHLRTDCTVLYSTVLYCKKV